MDQHLVDTVEVFRPAYLQRALTGHWDREIPQTRPNHIAEKTWGLFSDANLHI